jgi:hypothetical protein
VRVQSTHSRIQAEHLADRVCSAEIISNPSTSKAWLDEIKTLISNATHMYVDRGNLFSAQTDAAKVFLIIMLLAKGYKSGSCQPS